MIEQNYKRVLEEVAEQCRECGRNPEEVLLLAVSKTVGIDGAAKAIDVGAHDLGENRPDQLVQKCAAFPNVNWHFIGNIQSRRIGDIVDCAHLIHSLYTLKHAQKISERACTIGKIQDVLLEVNVSGEESKSGASPAEIQSLVEECSALPGISLRGLMTMAPQGDLAVAERTFEDLRRLSDELRSQMDSENAGQFDQLSMGMSEDWREAIRQGSTIVRIGRAIFSDDFVE